MNPVTVQVEVPGFLNSPEAVVARGQYVIAETTKSYFFLVELFLEGHSPAEFRSNPN